MLNILSLLIGIAAGVVAVFGLILGLISKRKEGQILNLVVIAVALVRLSLGGGLI